MSIFIDTSALLAILDADDGDHADASAQLVQLLDSHTGLVTHNYVIVETVALTQRRLGIDAVRAVHEDLVPAMTILWVDADLHRLATAALLAAGKRHVSLVDWVSFETMRSTGLDTAFAFDADFRQQGFRVVP